MTTLKLAAAVSMGGLLASTAAPIEWWAKLALDAPLLGVLWWTIAKTIPKLSEDHKEGCEAIAKEVKDTGDRTNELLQDALNAQRGPE